MKISAKLILLISLAFLGCLAVGGVALGRLSVLNTEIRSLSDKTIPGIEQLKNINTAFLDLRLLVNRHALSFDGDEKKVLDERIQAKQQQLKQSLQSYKALLTPEENKAYAQTEKLLLSYLTASDEVITLSRKYQNSKAQELMIALTEQGDRVTTLLDQATAQNHQQVQTSSQRAGAAYDNALSQLILSIVVVLVGLMLVGGWLFWLIRHGIRTAVSTISQIEQSRDFTLRAEIKSNDEISHLLMAFNALIARLQENFGQFQHGIQQVTSISDRLLDAASGVSNTAGIQQTSSSQMTVSINHVADQAQGASDRSHEAGEQATQGLAVIANTVADIHAISAAVSEAAKELHNLENQNRTIASVINVISDVAAQTNLLALNAAIEAARAGEMGRGFAVVADEVRNLAARTASATQEISGIINNVQNLSASAVHLMQEAVLKVEAGVSSAGEASQKMNDICSVAGDSEALVQDISHAIREQGQATDVIAQQVETVAQQANENSSSAASCQKLANELTGIAHSMDDVLRSYHL